MWGRDFGAETKRNKLTGLVQTFSVSVFLTESMWRLAVCDLREDKWYLPHLSYENLKKELYGFVNREQKQKKNE